MPGHTRALVNTLQLWANEDAEDMGVETPTILDYVCWRVASGLTLRKLTRELEDACVRQMPQLAERGLAPGWISGYLRRTFANAEAQLKEARRVGAQVLVDEGVDLVDDAVPTTEHLRHAELKLRARQWLAERYSRDDFGQQSKTLVNVSIGQVHLDALRKRNVEVSVAALPNGEVEEADCEIEETSVAHSATQMLPRESTSAPVSRQQGDSGFSAAS